MIYFSLLWKTGFHKVSVTIRNKISFQKIAKFTSDSPTSLTDYSLGAPAAWLKSLVVGLRLIILKLIIKDFGNFLVTQKKMSQGLSVAGSLKPLAHRQNVSFKMFHWYLEDVNLNWFHFLRGLFVILIDCLIFLSPSGNF